MKLTQEQAKLAADNFQLIPALLWKYFPNQMANPERADELTLIAHEALCVSAVRYDPSRGVKFSTLVCLNIRHGIWNHLKKKRVETLSGDSMIDETTSFFDMMSDGDQTDDMTDIVAIKREVVNYINTPRVQRSIKNGKQRWNVAAVRCLLSGERITDYGKRRGYNSREFSSFKQEYYKLVKFVRGRLDNE